MVSAMIGNDLVEERDDLVEVFDLTGYRPGEDFYAQWLRRLRPEAVAEWERGRFTSFGMSLKTTRWFVADLYDHPAAEDVPPMQGREYTNLLADVRANGVQVPLDVLPDCRVLDGRHRLRAAAAAGHKTVPIRVVRMEDAQAADHVLRTATLRRNLMDDQRAVLVARLAEKAAAAANKARAKEAARARWAAKACSEDGVSSEHAGGGEGRRGKGRTRERLARECNVPERKVKAAIQLGKEAPELAQRVLEGDLSLTKAQRQVKEDRAQKEATERSRNAPPSDRVDLRHGDFLQVLADIPDGSVSLILADPQYDRGTIPWYGKLAEFAARKLKPGGHLLAYAGNYAVPDLLNVMTPHLNYLWQLCLLHAGHTAHQYYPKVFVGWKPILWFVKGNRGGDRWLFDVIRSEQPDKKHHEWQQSIKEAEYVIEKLTLPGDLVCDPFAGSGTALIAAALLGRRAVGAEIRKDRYEVALGRIAEELAGTTRPVPAAASAPDRSAARLEAAMASARGAAALLEEITRRLTDPVPDDALAEALAMLHAGSEAWGQALESLKTGGK